MNKKQISKKKSRATQTIQHDYSSLTYEAVAVDMRKIEISRLKRGKGFDCFVVPSGR